MNYFFMVTPTVKRVGLPDFVPVDRLYQYQGFRSVFMFPSEAVDEIRAQGHLRRLTHLPVAAAELLIDFDDNLERAQEFNKWLYEEGYVYNRYASGNRSVHYHILTTLLTGPSVPYSHKKWVREHAPGADLTIYHHVGLFRLPQTWHEKNPGHRKQLVASGGYRTLHIPLEERKFISVPMTSLDPDEASRKLRRALQREQTEGGRRVHVWYIGAMAYDAGLSEHEAIDRALEWNQSHAVPMLDPTVIIKKIEEAYDARQLEA